MQSGRRVCAHSEDGGSLERFSPTARPKASSGQDANSFAGQRRRINTKQRTAPCPPTIHPPARFLSALRAPVDARPCGLEPPPRHEMNGTPRLRSGAFPQTPDTARRAPYDDGSPGGKPMRVRAPLTDINIMNKNPADDGTQPLISTDVIPAPTQRLYAFFFYGALAAWRAYDFINLHTEEADSLWLFMKWVMIDGLFLFGLPVLRIPWLEWSPPTMVFLFLVHALLDGMLMFRIGVSHDGMKFERNVLKGGRYQLPPGWVVSLNSSTTANQLSRSTTSIHGLSCITSRSS